MAMNIAAMLRSSHDVGVANRIAARWISSAISAYRRIALPYELHRRPALRIHFGCGEIVDQRFFNVDARPFRHVHYVTSSPLMPALPAQSAELIYACHAFEHISYRQQLDVLKRWHQLLKPGGEILLSVPDFTKVVEIYRRGEIGFDAIQGVLMGDQGYPGNFHFAIFTADHLTKLLQEAEFSNIREWHARDQKNWPRDWSCVEKISLNLRAEKL
jgi:predicted SAM-dependent methyltransferase